MKLRFINVGYGESILITALRTDGSKFAMLIDGGSGEDAEYAGHPARVRAAEYIRELGIARLDVMFNTHIHEDHTCGLPAVADTCEIGEYWCCALPDGSQDWPELPAEIVTLPRSDKCLRALNAHRDMLRRFRAEGVAPRGRIVRSGDGACNGGGRVHIRPDGTAVR
jgi:beta-lactamase superfamily II metal-dependent hydrolase